MPRTAHCLYCGHNLGFREKFLKRQFCSDEHQVIHQRESDLLVIARLQQAGPSPNASLSAALKTSLKAEE